jgi:hypothetical protein
MTSRRPGERPGGRRHAPVFRRHRAAGRARPRVDDPVTEQGARLPALWALTLERFRNHLHSGNGGTTEPRGTAGGDPDDPER